VHLGRGIALFLLIAAPVVIWNEIFPTARGQTEAELLASPFARLSLPDDVHALGVDYRHPEYSQGGLMGGTPQLLCAKLTLTFEVRRAGALRDVFIETALAAGKSRDEAEAATRSDVTRPMSVGMTSVRYQEGAERAWVLVSDLPEPFGGRCSAGRLRTYETLVNY